MMCRQLLCRQLLPGMWSTRIMAALLCWLFLPIADQTLRLVWFGNIVFMTLARTVIALVYRRKGLAEVDPWHWGAYAKKARVSPMYAAEWAVNSLQSCVPGLVLTMPGVLPRK